MKPSLPEALHFVSDDSRYVCRQNVSFQTLTSFRTGGTASLCLSPRSIEAFCEILRVLSDNEIPYLLLGHGTNVLAPDEGYDGILLLTDELKTLTVNKNTLMAEAGVMMNNAALAAAKASLSGLEFAFGIPGSVGGALAMNAGAYEHEIGELPMKITACDAAGNRLTLSGEDCAFGYRESIFQKEKLIALSCEITLINDDCALIRARMDDYLSRRKKSQPLEYPSAGSFFRRPEGHFAGRLIQDAALKGARVGGAQVSEKHAGFLINFDSATSNDVKALAKRVQDEVFDRFGVHLKREVKYLCEDDD